MKEYIRCTVYKRDTSKTLLVYIGGWDVKSWGNPPKMKWGENEMSQKHSVAEYSTADHKLSVPE